MDYGEEIRKIEKRLSEIEAEIEELSIFNRNTRMRIDNLNKFIDEIENPEKSVKSLLRGEWDFNEIAMPEPDVPWKERHDQTHAEPAWDTPDSWEHYCPLEHGRIVLMFWFRECKKCGIKQPRRPWAK